MLDNYAKSSLKRYKCKVKQMIFHVAKYTDYKGESRDPVHVAHKLLIQSAENMRLESYNSMWQRHAERGSIEINKRRQIRHEKILNVKGKIMENKVGYCLYRMILPFP